MITKHFFLEILKAVCFTVAWVPKLIRKFFQTMEPKLVQRCETEVVADACNASYCVAFTNTNMLFNRTTVVFTRTIVVFNRTILAITDVHYNYVVLVSVVLLIVVLLTPSPATT